MKRAPQTNSRRRKDRARVRGSIKLNEVMIIAEREGLLRGERTEVVRGRMPEALVARAKKRTGINSNTVLIQVALANIEMCIRDRCSSSAESDCNTGTNSSSVTSPSPITMTSAPASRYSSM